MSGGDDVFDESAMGGPPQHSPIDAASLFEVAKIVVVDDTPANTALLDRLLRAAGAVTVEAFTDPRLGLERCLAAPPDLILLDLQMPNLDGFEFMRRFNEEEAGRAFVPILVLTADATEEAKRRALAEGAKDFLAKPFDRLEVILRARNLLETAMLHRGLQEHNIVLQAELKTRRDIERAERELRARLATEVADVMSSGALAIVFQPVIDIATGNLVGAEALARFNVEPRRPPNEWFAQAGEVGLGLELELEAVAAALAQLPAFPADAFMAVNVSPATACSDELAAILESSSGPIVLELTEHARVDNYETLMAAVGRLHDHGARVAVDDAGAGYAGLQHILHLRPDILKLDLALTQGIDSDPVRRALAAALVGFSSEIGATLLAEGIETAAELETLRALGIPWGQGYYLGRPAPLPLSGA